MKKALLFLLIFSMLLIVACSKQVPEDFTMELNINGKWISPLYLSTITNSYSKYDENGEKISSNLDLSENERKELYKIMEEVWHYFPTSFLNEKEHSPDDSYYNLIIEMNGQSKKIKWTGREANDDEIASILTKRVYDAIEIIEKKQ